MIAAGARVGGSGARSVVGDEVWICARAVIHPGVHVGRSAIIAAGADVTADVPALMVAIGSPARIVPRRKFNNDGAPDISEVMRMVLGRLASERENCQLPPHVKVDPSAFVDADIHGGPAIIGPGSVLIGRSNQPAPGGGITVGAKVVVDAGCVLEGAGGISIGADSHLGSGTYILSNTHNPTHRSLPWMAAPVKIGKGAILGHDCVVVGPVCVGDGARIEPYSLVIRDVAAYSKTGGIQSVTPAPLPVQGRRTEMNLERIG